MGVYGIWDNCDFNDEFDSIDSLFYIGLVQLGVTRMQSIWHGNVMAVYQINWGAMATNTSNIIVLLAHWYQARVNDVDRYRQ